MVANRRKVGIAVDHIRCALEHSLVKSPDEVVPDKILPMAMESVK
jgi:hypothetical protein